MDNRENLRRTIITIAKKPLEYILLFQTAELHLVLTDFAQHILRKVNETPGLYAENEKNEPRHRHLFHGLLKIRPENMLAPVEYSSLHHNVSVPHISLEAASNPIQATK